MPVNPIGFEVAPYLVKGYIILETLWNDFMNTLYTNLGTASKLNHGRQFTSVKTLFII